MTRYCTMSDGYDIFVQCYEPIGIIQGHLHIIHGIAEHAGRYQQFAQYFQQRGYLVSLHDQRGHGKTAQKNNAYGYFSSEQSFHRLAIDAQEVITFVRQSYVIQQKTVLFGHSMGSAVARLYVQMYSEEVEKAIFCGTMGPNRAYKPGLVTAKLVAKLQGETTTGTLVDHIVFGNYTKRIAKPVTKFDWLAVNREAVSQYIEDPMCGFTVSNKFFVDLLNGLNNIHNSSALQAIRKDLPLLFISGTEDPVGNYGKGVYRAAQMYYRAGITQISVYLVEGKRHEILNEENRLNTYHTIYEWAKKQ